MSVFTEVSFDEADAFLRTLGLGPLHSIRACTGGIENTNYFVGTRTGAYVLTLFERLSTDELPFYLVQMLRQRSRPYLFSNSVAPAIVAATLKALDRMEAETALRDRLEENTRYFRTGLIARAFVLIPGEHPIIPVMLGEANAKPFAEVTFGEGAVFVIIIAVLLVFGFYTKPLTELVAPSIEQILTNVNRYQL